MFAIRARVNNGRLLVDEPTDLVVDDEGDSLDASDRAALDDAISAAWRSIQAGQGRRASDVLADLRSR